MTTRVDGFGIFGRDTSCTDALRSGRLVFGPLLVGEALYRRFTTRRGTLRGGKEEANYGFFLPDLVGSADVKNEIASLPGRLRQEAKKDQRIEDCVATVTAVRAGPVTTLLVVIRCTTKTGPFALKLKVSDVTVEMVGLTLEAA